MTANDLDRMTSCGCQAEGCKDCEDCGTLFLHGRCHPGGRIEVSYQNGSGMLYVGCVECKKPIAMISVAREKVVASGLPPCAFGMDDKTMLGS